MQTVEVKSENTLQAPKFSARTEGWVPWPGTGGNVLVWEQFVLDT